MTIVIYTADYAAQSAAQARARKREETIDSIPALEETDNVLYAALGEIFRKVEKNFLEGLTGADFKMDDLFGEGCWRGKRQQAASDILRNLGFKVDYSHSSNDYNEYMYLTWKKPKD
jgi:hypothetical protein